MYDYTQQYTTSIDLTVLETNTDKGKLKTNECGEYLMLLETSSVGSPSLGIPPSSVLVAPKGKQAASSQFTEIELYQYILLREMYSSVVDCKTIALSSNYYIDGKYNEALYFVRSFLQEKSYMGASPSVNAQIRDRLIRGLLESTSPDLAVSAIKKYSNLNAYFNASSVLEFAKSYAVAEVGGKIVLGTLGRIAKHPLIKNAVGKILSKFTTGTGSRIIRTLDEIAPNGAIPPNSQTNNLFHRWFDDLLPEELDLVLGNSTLKKELERRIRWPGGEHEWCMVCEIKTFKSWEIPMAEIHRFRTKTLDLTGVNPNTGAVFTHGGAGSTLFHNELRTVIQSSSSLADFNTRLMQLINRWQINPNLLPPLIK
ncbi:hypothetical protein [Flectobacillus rivi]|uniref:Uncharacterized protein n=1 Tax=Flectobacillus rivi TaxID=2984209 RepID=A0ABT6YWF2_9BACT|nr:hypothetical protein [Flectobacillus rivi]MDI9873199.1 hypothetical protein [Flectobacillus rivi]